MIQVGLTGWRDHPDLYPGGVQQNDKLQIYGSFFPTVEIDSAYYAILPHKNYQKWVNETPDRFRFVVKAYKGMTGQSNDNLPFASLDEMFTLYRESIQPLIDSGKLAMVLCQFPPWFDCQKDHIEKLRYFKRKLYDVPVAIEFRHQSWFTSEYRARTIDFLNRLGFIHTVCDEPQAGVGSVPIIPEVTSSKAALIRLHGRNVQGWQKETSGEEWRAVRYLYNYGEDELTEWVQYAEKLQKACEDVYVIFNNNSGRHAAANAQTFMRLADLNYKGLAPQQLSLFNWDGW
ncbi:uncharacterized protein YecE (DUF72 family) [Geomicrobium halophilum]|uniref:Uncharacterized protein YecE (DUF72 family) n=1 Tax=Geomicrobium halophilum TaxID=549000 RepID=A0A841PN97_9BACL|nr:DUF72 domain-containing protein [Geomicrobium halophilum]MBB6450219.1 uncharacterized protein YecE (DUF72 family) [Geomicrobium halophilum]